MNINSSSSKQKREVGARVKPTAEQIKALEQLEAALGWREQKAKRAALEYQARKERARASAGLGIILCPKWQGEKIREALLAMKAADKEVQS